MGFRFLDHTADVQVECRADSFAGLLVKAADALYAIALHQRDDGCGETRTVAVSGDTREEILVRWLQELIFLLETEHFVAARIAFADPIGDTATAQMEGYCCAPAGRAQEVKAATYHGIEVRETGGGFLARITFDL